MSSSGSSSSFNRDRKCPDCGGTNISLDTKTDEWYCDDDGVLVEDAPMQGVLQNVMEASAARLPNLGKELAMKSREGKIAANVGLHNNRDIQRKEKWDKLNRQLHHIGANHNVITECKVVFYEISRLRITLHNPTQGTHGSPDMKVAVEARMLLDFVTKKGGLDAKTKPYQTARSSRDLKALKAQILNENKESSTVDNTWASHEDSRLMPTIIRIAKEINRLVDERNPKASSKGPQTVHPIEDVQRKIETAKKEFKDKMSSQFKRLYYRVVHEEAGYSEMEVDVSFSERLFELLWTQNLAEPFQAHESEHRTLQTELLYKWVQTLAQEQGGTKLSRLGVQKAVADELKCKPSPPPSTEKQGTIDDIILEVKK
jgi:hypothetical protein